MLQSSRMMIQVPIRLTLPERMLIVRHRLGWEQSDLARVMNLSVRTISRIENGGDRNSNWRDQSEYWSRIVARWAVIESRYRTEIVNAVTGTGPGPR